MGVHLAYRLSPTYTFHPTHPSRVSESDLRYRVFTGDIEFVVGDCDFGTSWGWVPILDFAAAMLHLLRNLTDVSPTLFELTESESTISFRRDHDLVVISTSYVDCVATCTYSEVASEADRFARDVIRGLIEAEPEFENAPRFRNTLNRDDDGHPMSSRLLRGLGAGAGSQTAVPAHNCPPEGTRDGDLPARGEPNTSAAKDYGDGNGQIRTTDTMATPRRIMTSVTTIWCRRPPRS